MTRPIPRATTPVSDGRPDTFNRDWWGWLNQLGTPDSASLRFVDVAIPAAAVLTLNASPVQLVQGPGAGLMLVFEGLLVTKAAGVAYSGIAAGEDLSVRYLNNAGPEVAQVETTGFLDQTTAQMRYARPFAASSGNSAAVAFGGVLLGVSLPLVLSMNTGEITTGSSPLVCRTFYRVMPEAL